MQTQVYHPPLHSWLAPAHASKFGLTAGLLLSTPGHAPPLPFKIIQAKKRQVFKPIPRGSASK